MKTAAHTKRKKTRAAQSSLANGPVAFVVPSAHASRCPLFRDERVEVSAFILGGLHGFAVPREGRLDESFDASVAVFLGALKHVTRLFSFHQIGEVGARGPPFFSFPLVCLVFPSQDGQNKRGSVTT